MSGKENKKEKNFWSNLPKLIINVDIIVAVGGVDLWIIIVIVNWKKWKN